MRRGVPTNWIIVCIASLVLGLVPSPALASNGNAGIKLQKTVDSATVAPVLALTLQVSAQQAIPGDKLTYSGTVTNTGATLGLSGRFTAEAHADTDATVVYYWDELQTCQHGCGNGVANPHWAALVAFVASQPNYKPVQPPAVTSGMSLTATSVASQGVTYPTNGDAILGTDIGPKATGIWKYQASVTLTPAQVAVLSDPNQVQAVRNVVHFEVAPRNSQAAQPFDDAPQLGNPLQSQANAGAATNVVVTVTTPDGAKVQVTSSTVPALASLAPGASANYSTAYTVPVVAGKASGESDADYLKRLSGIDSSKLNATASATGSGLSGQVSASAGPVTTVEHLPIVGITKSGPGGAMAGGMVTYQLALQNAGGVQAASLAVNDTLSDGGVGTVSGAPASLDAAATGTAQASYVIPSREAAGGLTDTASVSWKDANGNTYGPVSSAFTTQVSRANVPQIMPVTTTPVQGNFFAEPSTAQTFAAKPGDSPAFSQSFPNIAFNPPSGTVRANGSGVDPQTRPFTDVTTDLIGNFAGTTVAQGNGVQAGVGALTSFDAAFRASMNVAQPGDVTFNVVADDGFLLGFGGGAVRVSGAYENAPASNTTPFNGYPLAGAFDKAGGAAPATYPVTVHFPAAGSYPYELDYFECCGSQLSLTMTVASVNPQSSPLSVYVGYADGLRPAGSIFPFPWDGSPNVTFVGCHPNCTFEAGAIRLDNSSNAPMIVRSLTVDLGTCHFAIWPQNLTLPAGGIMIFTQMINFFHEGCDNTDGQFDTSDIPFAFNCSQTGIIPKVNLTVDSTTTTYQDTQQVLNTGGKDAGGCGQFPNESESWQRIGGGGTPISVPLPPAVSLALTPASVSGDVVGQSQLFTVAAMDGSGQPVPNLPVTLGIFGANTQQLSATTDAGGLASFSYAGAAAGSDTVTATAFISGLQAVSNAASIPWNVPSGGSGATVVTTSGSAPPAISNLRPAVGALIGAVTPVTATITAASGIASWAVTSQAVPSGTVVTLASGTGKPPATLATFDPKGRASGTYAITVSATAGGGGRASATNQVFIGSGGGTAQQAGPSISAPTPADGAIVTKPIPITASFAPPAGETIASWSVTYQGQSNPTVVPLASGTGSPPVTLATFDPTLLPNDTYVISISATASGGGTQTLTSTVSVQGDLKLGRYTTTFQDMTVNAANIPINIQRIYDNTDKSVGDFGVGWRVSVVNFRTSSNRTLGAGGWSMYPADCTLLFCNYALKTSTPRFVTVTFPDTHQEIFDFTPSGGVAFSLFFGGTAAFTGRPGTGTTSTLQPLGDPGLSFNGDGNLYGSNFQPYDPQRFTLTTRDGRVLVLDRVLGLVSETDRNGNSLTIDPAGIHASSGPSVAFKRDAANRITQIVGPSGTINYTYSPAGDLTGVNYPNGATHAYTYDANHNLLSISGGGQLVRSLTYDSSGRITAVTDGNGNTSTIATNVAGQQQAFTDATGALTTVDTFDDRGDLIQQDQTFAGKTVTTKATYDTLGHQLSITDPLGHTTSQTYDAAFNVLTQTDANGNSTTYTYNAFGEPLTVTNPIGAVTTNIYDTKGNLLTTTDPNNHTATNTYDNAGHLLTTTDPSGRTTTRTYDAAGQLSTIADPAGNTTRQKVDPATGRVSSITDPTAATTTFTYDADGNRTGITDANGHTRTATHDSFDRVTSLTDPTGATDRVSYDAAGNPTSVTDRNGATISYTYDADSRLTTKTAPGAGTTTYTYDPLGRRAAATNPTAQLTFTYDDAGHMLKATTTGTGSPLLPTSTFTYTYDPAGNRTSTQGPGGTTTDAYDPAGRLASLTDPAGGAFAFRYDPAGSRTTTTRPNGINDTITYDAAGNLTSLHSTLGATLVNQADYTYNIAGLRASLATTAGTISYTYDAASQLTAATYPASSGLTAETYTYDHLGNRTSTATSPLGSFTYDSGDRLLSDATTTYTYDKEGNILTRTAKAGGATTTYTWSAEHQLTGITYADGTTTTYRYDPLGRRVEIDEGTTITRNAYDQNNIAAEYDATNTITAIYIQDPTTTNRALEMVRGGQRYFYLNDAQRSTTALTTLTGTVAATYTYSAFGNPTQTGSLTNPITYTGQPHHAKAGLLLFPLRAYDPSLGRFLSEDPVPSVNPYPYVSNSPSNNIDPSGGEGLVEYKATLAGIGAQAKLFYDIAYKKPLCTIIIDVTFLFLGPAAVFLKGLSQITGGWLLVLATGFAGSEVCGRWG